MIPNLAQKIPGYFPEGSGFGGTEARAEIWTKFDDFTALSQANETAANGLVKAAKSGDPDAMVASLKIREVVVKYTTVKIKIKPI